MWRTTESIGLHDYMNERKEDMLSAALKQNVIGEGKTKRKLDERYMKESYKDSLY